VLSDSPEECLLPVLRPFVSDCKYVCSCVRPFVWSGTAPTGRISVNFYIQDFNENLSTQSKFNLIKNIGHQDDLSRYYCCRRH